MAEKSKAVEYYKSRRTTFILVAFVLLKPFPPRVSIFASILVVLSETSGFPFALDSCVCSTNLSNTSWDLKVTTWSMDIVLGDKDLLDATMECGTITSTRHEDAVANWVLPSAT